MMRKTDLYKQLVKEIKAFCEGNDNPISVLANCASAMKETFPKEYFWVGFYIVDGSELFLGPFQGTPACTRIKYGKGVCGTAWKEMQSLVVPDVHMFKGHIACSSLSESEIVVPIMSDGRMVGEIDIDSREKNTFDDTDREHLEQIASILGNTAKKLARLEAGEE